MTPHPIAALIPPTRRLNPQLEQALPDLLEWIDRLSSDTYERWAAEEECPPLPSGPDELLDMAALAFLAYAARRT